MAIEDTLRGVELFAELPDEDLRRLAKLVVERRYRAGEVIVRENEAGVAFYVVASGRVEAVKSLGTSDEQVMATFAAGDFFGEMSILLSEPPTADVVARRPLRCLVLPGPALETFLTTNPRVAYRMIQALARRLRTANLWRS